MHSRTLTRAIALNFRDTSVDHAHKIRLPREHVDAHARAFGSVTVIPFPQTQIDKILPRPKKRESICPDCHVVKIRSCFCE